MHLFPVIMCGGSGTRLWPSSTDSRPKQFLPLTSQRSIFQETALRVAGIDGVAELVIVAGAVHADLIESQLAEIGVAGVVLLEPRPRDSGPAIAAAAAWIAGRDPDGIAVIVASDHHLPDAARFRAAVAAAAQVALEGRIVTFGVVPSSPSSAYGYIRPGTARGGAFDVAAFVEKPSLELAADYVAAGYLWNSGNFIARARTLLAAFQTHAPDVGEAARAAVSGGRLTPGRVLLGEGFLAARKISFDHAVMEKTDRASVLRVSFDWSDLGAWSAIHAVSAKDGWDNTIVGDVLTIDTHSSLIRSDGPSVAAIGLTNIAVIAENGSVLVCDLTADQSVKVVATHFKASRKTNARGRGDLGEAAGRVFDDLNLWLRGSALPVWATLGVDNDGWGFLEALDPAGRSAGHGRRARVQARQVYVYARAGRFGWPGPWRGAVTRGLDALEQHFRRPDGLYRRLVDDLGRPLDETALLYEQAFVLLALAEAAKVRPDDAELVRRADLLRAAIGTFRWGAGGFREVDDQPFQANCHMHLFEACQSWVEVESVEPGPWRDLAGEIAALATERFYDPGLGVLYEFFDADWAVAGGRGAGEVWPGHQFEWAWLLEQWRGLGGEVQPSLIESLYLSGRKGFDPRRDVFVQGLTSAGQIVDANARLWPQTEALRAAQMMWRLKGSDEYAQHVVDGARGLWRYLETPIPGLWRDVLAPNGAFQDVPAPASSLYHLVCLLRPAESREAGGGC